MASPAPLVRHFVGGGAHPLSAHLQVSDVVHHGPAFDGKALGGDVVVVNLQPNNCISGRLPTRLCTPTQGTPWDLVMGMPPPPIDSLVSSQLGP